MGWVKLVNVLEDSYFLHMGNGVQSDNIYLSFADSSSGPYFALWKGSNRFLRISSSTTMKVNQWQHIAATWDGYNAAIYINSTLVASGSASGSLNNIVRTMCYFGKSNWPSQPLANAYYDEIRFYNRYNYRSYSSLKLFYLSLFHIFKELKPSRDTNNNELLDL